MMAVVQVVVVTGLTCVLDGRMVGEGGEGTYMIAMPFWRRTMAEVLVARRRRLRSCIFGSLAEVI